MIQQIMNNGKRMIKNQQLKTSIFLLSCMISQEICHCINFLICMMCLYSLEVLANFPTIINNGINK